MPSGRPTPEKPSSRNGNTGRVAQNSPRAKILGTNSERQLATMQESALAKVRRYATDTVPKRPNPSRGPQRTPFEGTKQVSPYEREKRKKSYAVAGIIDAAHLLLALKEKTPYN